MFKKDSIFWLATFIFVSAIVIYGLTQNQLWLFLLAGSYLLRPTLASLNIAKSLVDERQMSIQYRSGNIAFAVMIIACIIMAVYQSSKDDHSWEFFNAIVIIGLAAKALSNVFLIGNYRESGTKIIIAVGLMLVLFVSLENGLLYWNAYRVSAWISNSRDRIALKKIPTDHWSNCSGSNGCYSVYNSSKGFCYRTNNYSSCYIRTANYSGYQSNCR